MSSLKNIQLVVFSLNFATPYDLLPRACLPSLPSGTFGNSVIALAFKAPIIDCGFSFNVPSSVAVLDTFKFKSKAVDASIGNPVNVTEQS